MWFDPHRALAELRRDRREPAPATSATSATSATPPPAPFSRVANVAEVAAPQALDPKRLAEALDAFEERVAIRRFDGGQRRAEAERAALGELAAAFGLPPELVARHLRAGNREPPG